MEENNKIKLFISYSHKDREHCAELHKHLTQLKRTKLVDTWQDGELMAGDNWDEQIKKHLVESEIVVFLLSIDFIASNYIYEVEMQMAYEKHKRGELIIVPVILKKCDIEGTIFERIQGLPIDFEPILSSKWHSKDDAYFSVVEGLKRIIKKQSEIKAQGKNKANPIILDGISKKVNESKEIELIENEEIEEDEELSEEEELVLNDLENACLYFDQEKWDKAFAILYKYRNHDLFDSECQFLLGSLYEFGDVKNVGMDYVEAVKWYQKSADQDDPNGQFCLGNMYAEGNGVAKNMNKAKELYKLAARQGDEDAQDACRELGIKW